MGAQVHGRRHDDDDGNPVLEDQYERLKSRLVELDYTSPFGVDSIDLVATLLWDLEKSNEKSKLLRSELDRVESNALTSMATVGPLKKGLARYKKENSALHLEMISLAESSERQEAAWEATKRSLNAKISQSAYVAHARGEKVHELERRVELLQHKLERFSAEDASKTVAMPKALNDISNQKTKAAKANFDQSNSPAGIQTVFDPEYDSETEGMLQGKAKTDEMDLTTCLTSDVNVKLITTLQRNVTKLQAEKQKLVDETAQLHEDIHKRNTKLQEVLTTSYDSRNSAGPGSALSPNSKVISNMIPTASRNFRPDSTEEFNRQIDFLSSQVASYEEQLQKSKDEIKSLSSVRLEAAAANEVASRVKAENQELKQKLSSPSRKSGRTDKSSPDKQQLAQHRPDKSSPDKKQKLQDSETQTQVDFEAALASDNNDLGGGDVVKKMHRMENAIFTYQEERTSILESLRSANDENEILNQRLETESDKSRTVQSSYDSLVREHEMALSRLSSLESEFNLLQESLTKSIGDNTHVSKSSAALKSKISHLENRIATLSSENKSLLKSLRSSEESREELVSQLKQDRTTLIGQKSSNSSSTVVSKLTAERGALQSKVSSLLIELSELKTEKEAVIQESQTLASKLDSVSQDLLSVTASRNECTTELASLRDTVASYKLEVAELKPLTSSLPTELASLRKSLSEAHDEKRAANSKLFQVEVELSKLQDEVRISYQPEVDRLSREKESLAANLKSVESKMSALHRDLQGKTEEVGNLNHEISILKSSINSKERELGNFSTTSTCISKENKALLKQKEEVELELASVKSTLWESQQTLKTLKSEMKVATKDSTFLETKVQSLKSELASSVTKLMSSDSRIRVLTDESIRQESTVATLNDKINNLEASNNNLQSLLSRKEEKLQQLTSLCQSLESSLDQSNVKTNSESEKLQKLSNELQNSEKANCVVKNELHACEVEVSRLKNLLSLNDRRLDELVSNLDEKSEENSILNRRLNALSDQLSSVQNTQTGSDNYNLEITNVLAAKEHELNACRASIESLELTISTLKSQDKRKDSEIRAIAIDLQNMTRENQSVSQALVSSQFKVNTVQRELQVLQEKLKRESELVAAKEIQLRDIMTSYRKLCQEHSISSESVKDYGVIQSTLQKERLVIIEKERKWKSIENELQDKIFDLKNQIKTYQNQLSTLTARIETTSDNLHIEKQSNASLQKEKESMSEISSSLLQSTRQLSSSKNVTAAHAKSLSDRITVLNETNSTLTSELQDARNTIDNLTYTLSKESHDNDDDDTLVKTKKQLAELESKLKDQEKSLKESEASRKMMQRYAKKYEKEIQKREAELSS